jgi:hypothetical protein
MRQYITGNTIQTNAFNSDRIPDTHIHLDFDRCEYSAAGNTAFTNRHHIELVKEKKSWCDE